MKNGSRIAAVIVTYNRLDKLMHTLECYENQITPCNDIIVVNNCSTDGTEDFLEEWQKEKAPFNKHIIKTETNSGGAGGFNIGMEYALTLDVNWVWVGDDDAYPAIDAFSLLMDYVQKNRTEDIAAICSSVLYVNGEYTISHRAKLVKGKTWSRLPNHIDDYQRDEFETDLITYVGSAYNVNALKEYGLCNKDLFIYYDDTEHSMRMKKYGRIVCLPRIKVVHDAPNEYMDNRNKNLSWKNYYSIRNRAYVYLHYHKPTADKFIKDVKRGFWNYYMMNIYGKDSMDLMRAALSDAKKGRLGIHPVYKPGFFIQNDLPKNPNWFRLLYRIIHPQAGV